MEIEILLSGNDSFRISIMSAVSNLWQSFQREKISQQQHFMRNGSLKCAEVRHGAHGAFKAEASHEVLTIIYSIVFFLKPSVGKERHV